MNEHQVVVVFDVVAPTLLDAGRQVAKHLRQSQRRMLTLGVDSWWMPEEPLRSQVDRNDNAAMHLEPDDLPEELFVEDDASDEPTVWAHDPTRTDAPLALLSRHDVRAALAHAHGGRDHLEHAVDALWEHIVRGLPTAPPAAAA